MKKAILAILLMIFCSQSFAQKFEGLALKPPMGWNSWNTFGVEINEKLVKETADLFISLGLKEAGYQYIVLDDGWLAMERDANGNLLPHPDKFPGGMKALGDYIHAKGLKFGIYNCAGTKTCGGYPGTRGHEYQDARTYASWGVDFLKYDWCNTQNINPIGAYSTMRDAIFTAGRPMVFSICEWGDNDPWKWGKDIGHMWRATGDITNCWDCEIGHGSWSSLGVWKIINLRKGIKPFAGPDHWNDFDMMEVGNGMTDAEDRSHFAMWCMLSSPLILGNDIRTMSKETLKTLTNKEVIAVNQDKLGIQGFRFTNENNLEIWIKPLDNNEWAMVFINMGSQPVNLVYDWKKHPIEDDLSKRWTSFEKETFNIRDLFNQKDLGTTQSDLKTTLGSHDVLMVRLKK